MRHFSPEQAIFKIAALPQANFTVVAATDVITSTAHGLSNGDCVWVSSGTTLPAGLSASTNYYVIEATANTFKLSAIPNGPSVNITDTGTGTHTYALKGKVFMGVDWRNIQLNLATSNSANLTIKIQGSDQSDVDFNAAQSPTNRWDYLQIKDLNNNNTFDGDTGIALTGTDDYRHFEINNNKKLLYCAQITTWVAGKVNLFINGASD